MSDIEQRAQICKEEGTAAYKRRDFETAEAKYREAYNLTPNNLLLLNNIAATYLEQGRFDDCLKVTQEALDKRYEVKADYAVIAKILNRRGACFAKMKKYDEAIEAYKKSLVEVNDRATRAILRDVESARDKWSVLQAINPQEADAYRVKGNEFFKEKRYPQAKEEYDLALKKNPYDPKLYSNRAACYIQLFEYPSALKDCEKALNLIEYCETHINDPITQTDELEIMEEKLKRTPVDAAVKVKIYTRQGMCHFRVKDYNKATTSYQEALKIDPNSNEARRGLEQVIFAVQQNASSHEVDQEQQARAFADPEIQQILGDPQMRLILQQLQADPSRIAECLQDPKIANAFQKLMAAGIIKTA